MSALEEGAYQRLVLIYDGLIDPDMEGAVRKTLEGCGWKWLSSGYLAGERDLAFYKIIKGHHAKRNAKTQSTP